MRSYKESMNQIVMTDALKERIRQQAAADSSKTALPVRRRYYMVCANIAACLLLLLCTQMRLSEFLIPTQHVTLPMPSATAASQAVAEDTALPVQTPAAKKAREYSAVHETDIPNESHVETDVEMHTKTIVSEENNEVQADTAKKQTISGTPLQTEKPPENLFMGDNALTAPDTAAPKKDAVESTPEAPPQAKPPLAQGAPSAGGGGGGGGGSTSGSIAGWTEATNAMQEFSSLETLRKQCSFAFRTPAGLPEGYTLHSMELLWGGLVQLTYDGSPAFIFRAAACGDDISGDYHEYDEITTKTVRNAAVSLRGNAGLVHTAVWQEEGVCYAILTDGIPQAQMLQLIAAMQ